MSLEALFISGPPRGGKTTIARLIATDVAGRPVHYVRMRRAADGHTNLVTPLDASSGAPAGPWASVHRVTYSEDHVFETLPEALRVVRRIERNPFVVLEADADACLRHAYPYDYRVFVMAPPRALPEVFRDSHEAASALQQVMQDTAAFASEIFGIMDPTGLDDTVGVQHAWAEMRERPVEQLDVSEAQIRHFLNSPLGAEIASRIQLQPDYCALIESDIAIINTGLGAINDALDACVKRLEKLLSKVRHDARRHSVLYWGDIVDQTDPTYGRLVKRLKVLLSL
jgi:hypothetical protein